MRSYEAKTQFGIVGAIDVLGASTYSMEEARKYLETRDKLLADMESVKNSLVQSFPDTDEPMTYTFGDTILFVWNIGDRKRLSALAGAATWLRSFVALGACPSIRSRKT